MPVVVETPAVLKPFVWHGVDASVRPGLREAYGPCPFCGKDDGKFSINIDSGRYKCFHGSCDNGDGKNDGGNIWTFLRWLWSASVQATSGKDTDALRADRKLLHADTLDHWGACKSVLTGDWLLPGHGADGKLNQLYSYRKDWKSGKLHLFPTPDGASPLHHQLFGVPLLDKDKPDILVAEGPWDGMALWEAIQLVKELKEKTNIVAVPACNVMAVAWMPLFADKNVTFLYDSDHLRTDPKTKQVKLPAGWAGMRHAARTLAVEGGRAKSVRCIFWGPGGYDKKRPSGFDVRDFLAVGTTESDRARLVVELLKLVKPIPGDWVKGRTAEAVKSGGVELSPLPCSDWRQLTLAWKKALHWRESLDDALAVCLAVCVSTEQVGDQLFLQLIASAGAAKTQLCQAMLVSKRCHPLEHLTGFLSGCKDGSGQTFSLIDRINRKTLITPEGDVMISNPLYAEIMSQQRRIFDGTTGATYKNSKDDQRYTGLRTPWIIAGTPALMDADQSRLGDRFLRVRIDDPDEDEQREIQRRICYTADRCVALLSNCDAESQMDEALMHAYQVTGGYVDYLRAGAPEMLAEVTGRDDGREEFYDHCSTLARFASDFRAQPHRDSRREVEACKEQPTRLTHQLVRLGRCLMVSTNKSVVDDSVMNMLTRVTLDTSHGRSLDIARKLAPAGVEGVSCSGLSVLLGKAEDRLESLLRFLEAVGVAETRRVRGAGAAYTVKWRLTARSRNLYAEVVGDQG